MGILQRAEALKPSATPEQAEEIDAARGAADRLGDNEMGTLFKVMAVTRRGIRDVPRLFRGQTRRHEQKNDQSPPPSFAPRASRA